MNDQIFINLNGSEYQYEFSNGKQTIKRNGEHWRDETGDNLLLAMAQHIQDLEIKLEDAVDVIEDVVSKNPTTCDSRLVDFLEECRDV